MTTLKPIPCANGALQYLASSTELVLIDTGNYPAGLSYEVSTYTGAGATFNWTFVSGGLPIPSNNSPTARVGTDVASDGTANIVLFGGKGSSETRMLNDTWTFNGTTWTQASPATSPTSRAFHSMANLGASVVVLFGGQDTLSMKNDTWSWNTTTWSQVTVANGAGPIARINASMANNSTTAAMFGGQGELDYLSDLWSYTTVGGWVQHFPTSGPSARTEAAFCYDGTNYVLFGGKGGYGCLGDTWLLNPTTYVWTKQAPTASPPNLAGAMMARDTATSQTVLFGGYDQWGNLSSNTWSWTGTAWVAL